MQAGRPFMRLSELKVAGNAVRDRHASNDPKRLLFIYPLPVESFLTLLTCPTESGYMDIFNKPSYPLTTAWLRRLEEAGGE